jgi:hypothetical protein
LRRWLVSPAWDLGFLVLPGLLGTALGLALPAGVEGGAFAYVVLVVLVDVAHTWASLYRTALEPGQDPLLLPLAAGIAGLGALSLWTLAPQLFWPGMAAVAIFHFVRQQGGICALYQRGLPLQPLERALERAAVEGACLLALLWWLCHLPRPYAWFTPQDFPSGLPAWAFPLGLALWGGLLLAHLVLRLRSRLPWGGRDLCLLTTAFCWLGGIGFSRGDLSFTLSNVLLHGVAYFGLVHRASRAAQGSAQPTPIWLRWPLFLALPASLALAEELAWDLFVWQERLPPLLPELPGLTPLLAVPQLTHYILDGWIWRGARVEGR